MTRTKSLPEDHAADAAGAEAFREARAGALAEARQESARSGRSQDRERPARRTGAEAWRTFSVDVWITNLNATEFGLFKRARNRAKSRQFTAGMDIFAEVSEDGVRTGLLGYREDLWTKAQGMDRRLVIKLFSDSLVWQATLDLMLGRSLQQTLGARGLPVPAYAINTNEDTNMIYLERSAHKWPLLPENFSFFLMEEGEARFYRLKRHFFDWGMDYTLYDQQDRAVGYLDGKVFSIGGKWKGGVAPGHASRNLLKTLKLFGGTMIFSPDCRRHLKRLYREVKAGRLTPRIESQEADLYLNPRRVR